MWFDRQMPPAWAWAEEFVSVHNQPLVPLYIHIHPPKCAGTSITVGLSALTTYRDIEIGATAFGEAVQTPYSDRFGLRKHSTPRTIRQVVGETTWKSFFKFSFARNPLDRAVSSYNYLQQTWRDWDGSKIMDGLSTFEQFVGSTFFAGNGTDDIFRPQAHWLCDPLAPLDLIGRVETLTHDFAIVLDHLGIDPAAIALGRANATDRAATYCWTDGPALRTVQSKYEADFERFGYTPPCAVRTA